MYDDDDDDGRWLMSDGFMKLGRRDSRQSNRSSTDTPDCHKMSLHRCGVNWGSEDRRDWFQGRVECFSLLR